MVNIKEIQKNIQEEVTKLTCERFNLTGDEVKVSFANSGDLKVVVSPRDFIEKINCRVSVEIGLEG